MRSHHFSISYFKLFQFYRQHHRGTDFKWLRHIPPQLSNNYHLLGGGPGVLAQPQTIAITNTDVQSVARKKLRRVTPVV